jgi:hypothetical protein
MNTLEALRKQMREEGLRLHISRIQSDTGKFYMLSGRDIEKLAEYENISIISETKAVFRVVEDNKKEDES